jgi:thymidylate synthase
VLKINLGGKNNRLIMPLLTTKRVAWKAIYHELIWFLRGSTDISYLQDNKVAIWDGNSTREYLDKSGLSNYVEGELGPIYGFQWRHWGSKYVNKETREALDVSSDNITNGIDQIEVVINRLRNDPWDRRMIVSAWNVSALADMALPPCHYSFQFHVDPDANGNPAYLNCLVNMRSTDVFLGLPFNIASYALLTHIIAKIVNLSSGQLSISMADCHLYVNHEEQAKTMLSREIRNFPEFSFSTRVGTDINDFIYSYNIDDYIITGYNPHPAIKANMAV